MLGEVNCLRDRWTRLSDGGRHSGVPEVVYRGGKKIVEATMIMEVIGWRGVDRRVHHRAVPEAALHQAPQ
jgi:hypothetical protein